MCLPLGLNAHPGNASVSRCARALAGRIWRWACMERSMWTPPVSISLLDPSCATDSESGGAKQVTHRTIRHIKCHTSSNRRMRVSKQSGRFSTLSPAVHWSSIGRSCRAHCRQMGLLGYRPTLPRRKRRRLQSLHQTRVPTAYRRQTPNDVTRL